MKFYSNFKTPSDIINISGDFDRSTARLVCEGNSYKTEGADVSVNTEFAEHSSGVVRRSDSVKNVSGRDVNLLGARAKFVFSGGEYEVYTQYSEWCAEGQGRWQELVTEVSAGNDDLRVNCGSVPFVAIYNKQNERGVAFHILAESKWSFKVKKSYYQSGHIKKVIVELGISDDGFSYKLAVGEELKLPDVIFYEFKSKRDMDAYKLHRYYNELYPARSMPVIYDSWMSKFDNIDFDILSEQLERARDIGAEYFVIDAGWFGRPNDWADQVGDWNESTEFSMRGRMKEFADKVRSFGLKFGLWFEIERAAMKSRAVSEHPEHYFFEDGQYFVNFAKKETCEYIFEEVARNVRKYGIEFIKFDFNAPITYDKSGRAFLDYFEGYNSFIERLGREFPSLYLQNCASGGLRMALAAMRGFDSFWMSDNHSLYTQLEIFKNTMIRMPSRALERWITVRSLENFEPLYGGGKTEKILVSGDAAWGHIEAVDESFLRLGILGGPIGISCDVTKLSDSVLSLLATEISAFKNERDFWAGSECRILCDTESLLVLQFSDSSLSKIKICTYLKVPHQNEVTVYPVCAPDARYVVEGCEMSGAELEADGVTISLGNRFTAKSVKIEKV